MEPHDMFWTSSRYKGKGKGFGKSTPSVNAYATQHFDIGGLELCTSAEADLGAAQRSGNPSVAKASTGMLDCGATASAAPEVAVQGLIQAILQADKSAQVTIEPYMRPHFRFGNGRWGQALYRATLVSNVSVQPRKFSLFSLPNPEELSVKNIVPILIGMDHLGKTGCQMMVDFMSGYVIDGVDKEPSIYKLKSNAKGHFEYDSTYPCGQPVTSLVNGHLAVSSFGTLHVSCGSCTDRR